MVSKVPKVSLVSMVSMVSEVPWCPRFSWFLRFLRRRSLSCFLWCLRFPKIQRFLWSLRFLCTCLFLRNADGRNRTCVCVPTWSPFRVSNWALCLQGLAQKMMVQSEIMKSCQFFCVHIKNLMTLTHQSLAGWDTSQSLQRLQHLGQKKWLLNGSKPCGLVFTSK